MHRLFPRAVRLLYFVPDMREQLPQGGVSQSQAHDNGILPISCSLSSSNWSTCLSSRSRRISRSPEGILQVSLRLSVAGMVRTHEPRQRYLDTHPVIRTFRNRHLARAHNSWRIPQLSRAIRSSKMSPRNLRRSNPGNHRLDSRRAKNIVHQMAQRSCWSRKISNCSGDRGVVL